MAIAFDFDLMRDDYAKKGNHENSSLLIDLINGISSDYAFEICSPSFFSRYINNIYKMENNINWFQCFLQVFGFQMIYITETKRNEMNSFISILN